MLATDSRDRPSAPPPDLVPAAFRDLHARRLHGFALMLTLGDRAQAGRLAAAALAAGVARVDELRHPERAAAWLRAHVTRAARTRAAARDGVAILAELGTDAGVVAGLAALGRIERAALISTAIERLDGRDAATVAGRDGQALDRLLERARLRYADAYAAAAPPGGADGPLAERLRAIATRAMS